MRFICDKMLIRLGRWLRVAGYDTLIIESSIKDKEILEKAIEENRYLLTRDRHFLELGKGFPLLLYLKGNLLAECISELNKKIQIDWEYAPFSRCLICNALLKEACDEEKKLVPQEILKEYKQFLFCEHCHKIYWMGSHTKRMLAALKQMKN